VSWKGKKKGEFWDGLCRSGTKLQTNSCQGEVALQTLDSAGWQRLIIARQRELEGRSRHVDLQLASISSTLSKSAYRPAIANVLLAFSCANRGCRKDKLHQQFLSIHVSWFSSDSFELARLLDI
jgi:hypothetical protein